LLTFIHSACEKNILQTVLLSFFSVFIFSMPSKVIIIVIEFIYAREHKLYCYNKVNEISDQVISEAHYKNYSHFQISQLKSSSKRSHCFLIIFNYNFLHTADIYITYGPCTTYCTYSTYFRELKQPRRRRQQNPHIFAYLTMKNSIFARFARHFSFFDILKMFAFLQRREKTCFAGVWTS